MLEQYINILIDQVREFPPEVGIYAIPLSVAVFSIALPLIFNMIGRIDDKYNVQEFVHLYLKSCSLLSFIAFAIIDILLIIIYLPLWHSEYEYGLRIALCIASTALPITIFFALMTAIKFNNAQKLLSLIHKKYESHITAARYIKLLNKETIKDKKIYVTTSYFQQYYSLISHLICYAEVKNHAFLTDIYEQLYHDIKLWKEYYKSHFAPQTTISYPKDLYDMMIYVSKGYKRNCDNGEINELLANLYASLFDYDGETMLPADQNTYDALFQTLVICMANKHNTLINEFQRIIRLTYARKRIARIVDAKTLREFGLILNATLYGMGLKDCVNDAIKNNFDSGISAWQWLPRSATESIDVFLWMDTELRKEWHNYVYTINNFTSSTNFSKLHQYFTQYFTYLALCQYYKGEEKYHLEYAGYYNKSNITTAFDILLPQYVDVALSELPKRKRSIIPANLFEEIKKNTYDYLFEEITTAPLNSKNCTEYIKKDIEGFDLPSHLRNLVTYNDIYIQSAFNEVVLPDMNICKIERAALTDTYHSTYSNFISSRIYEQIIDALADIYCEFETIQETVSWKEVRNRVYHYVCSYDYSFLTIGSRLFNILSSSQPLFRKFTRYFPQDCIILIAMKDLPYFDWNNARFRVTKVEDAKTTKSIAQWSMPKVDVSVNMDIKIRYNKDTKIRVLKVE